MDSGTVKSIELWSLHLTWEAGLKVKVVHGAD